MFDKGFMTYKGDYISIEKLNVEKEKNLLIRQNPTNINPGKLSTYNFITFDGFALRVNSIKTAVQNYLPFLNNGGYIAIISYEGKNVFSKN